MSTLTTNFDTHGGLNKTLFPANEVVPEALVFTQTTIGDEIDGDKPSLVVPYVRIPSAAEIVTEGAQITEKDTTIGEMAIYTQKVAVLNVVSNEIARNMNLTDMLSGSLLQAVIDKADAILLQNPAHDDEDSTTSPVGLFNTPGAVNGRTLDGTDGLDPIVSAIATVTGNGGTPTSIILNHATWATLLQLKFADGRPIISADNGNSPTPLLFGLPVVINRQAPNGKILIHSKEETISAISGVILSTSTDRYFDRDSAAWRVTFRLGWGVIRPNRLAVITVNTSK